MDISSFPSFGMSLNATTTKYWSQVYIMFQHTFFLFQGDIDGNGTLDCEEFVTVLLHIKKMSNEEYLPKAFKYFDKDGNGYIEMEELMEALADDELGPNEQVVKDIIRDVDTDKVSSQNKLKRTMFQVASSERSCQETISFPSFVFVKCKLMFDKVKLLHLGRSVNQQQSP